MRRALSTLMTIFLSLLAACGDDDDDGAGPIAIEDLPVEVAQTFCDALEPCLGPLLELTVQGDDCVTRTTASFTDRDFAQVQVAIATGSVLYHADRARACLDAYAALGCEITRTRAPAICEEALEGTIPLGDDCNIDEECEGSAYCAIDAACPGSCAALEAEGARCDRAAACEDGLACQQGECVVPAAAGEDCGGSVAPDCDPGLLCLGQDEQTHETGSCQTLEETLVRAEGEDCSVLEGPLCEQGLSCILDSFDAATATASFLCVTEYGSGEACKAGFPDPCPDGEACDADPLAGDLDGTCVPLPGPGEPCLQGFDTRCATGLACDGDTCIVVHAIGETCSQDQGCYSGNCVSGNCQAPAQCEGPS